MLHSNINFLLNYLDVIHIIYIFATATTNVTSRHCYIATLQLHNYADKQHRHFTTTQSCITAYLQQYKSATLYRSIVATLYRIIATTRHRKIVATLQHY